MKTVFAYALRYFGLTLATLFWVFLALVASFMLWCLYYEITERGWWPAVKGIILLIGAVFGMLITAVLILAGFDWGTEYLKSKRR